MDENGVPLEHLVTCLGSVELKQGPGSVKYLVWIGAGRNDESHEGEPVPLPLPDAPGQSSGRRTDDTIDSPTESKCVSPPLANQLALFSRELVDLLKTAPHCQLPFNRFIPAYHHHFGRQCRVADYGFTKLIDLLEALAHTVQVRAFLGNFRRLDVQARSSSVQPPLMPIHANSCQFAQVMGDGNKRVVTLSHRAQVRRFTSDLLRVLKAQASKQVPLSQFPCVYARVIGTHVAFAARSQQRPDR